MTDQEPRGDLDTVIREIMANSTPAQHSPEFDGLVDVLAEELGAQIAIGRLGPINPPAQGVRSLALLAADAVDRVYHLQRRARPGQHLKPTIGWRLDSLARRLRRRRPLGGDGATK